VRLERLPGIEQPLRLDERLGRRQREVIWRSRHTGRSARERPAQLVAGPSVAGSTLDIAIAHGQYPSTRVRIGVGSNV
jgi:hypothetical protein